MRLRNSLAALFVILLLGGCASPAVVTPKPDIRPVQASHERAQVSVGKARQDVGQLRQSQARASQALQKATASLDKVTGASQAVTDAKQALFIVRNEFTQSQQYANWAAQELDNAWSYEALTGQALQELGVQIDESHKNEQVLADWKKANEPVIKEVNKYWGLGAFAYGFRVLFRHLLILALVGAGLAVVLFVLSMFFPVIGVGLKTAGAFLSALFGRIKSYVGRK